MYNIPSFSIRTDMADEAHKLWQTSNKEKSELSGVSARSYNIYGMEVSEVLILDEQGEASLNKARGKYFSLSLPEYCDRGSDAFVPAVKALSELIRRCNIDTSGTVLIAALGNPDITPDALGNITASNILVTAHLEKKDFPQFSRLALCRPGVLGTSGIESSEQIKAICALTNATTVIVVDALAGSDTERLCKCIQISDAGISPGSGVGNSRKEISTKLLGVPVISIGIPTVIDAAYFGGENFGEMFVTPRNIDSLVRRGAKLIGYAINSAVHTEISIEDMDALLN